MADMSAVATSPVQAAAQPQSPPPAESKGNSVPAVLTLGLSQPSGKSGVLDPPAQSTPPPGAGTGDPAKPAEPAQAAKSEKDKADAARFAALAKRERAAFAAQQEAKAVRERVKADLAELEKFKTVQALAKTDPLAFLASQGITYEQVVQQMLSGGAEAPAAQAKALEAKVDARIQQVEAKIQARADEEKARQAQEAQELLSQHEHDAVEFVKTNAEKYEFINLYEQHAEVPKLIRLAYEKSVQDGEEPKILSFEEAADLIEKHLEEQATKAQSAKKIQAKIAAQTKPASEAGGEKRVVSSAGTLTNDLTASTTGPSVRYLSEEERIENARRVAESFRTK